MSDHPAVAAVLAEPECNGICLHASDIGVPVGGNPVAYAHPDCELHNPTAPTEADSGHRHCECWYSAEPQDDPGLMDCCNYGHTAAEGAIDAG